jgi:phosphoribosylformylglycinamidine cyclo-ligase
MTEHNSTTYRSVGVDYDLLDAGKRQAILAALGTSALAAARGAQALDASRGEPAFVMSAGGQRLALVIECLGTKSILAREYEAATGVNRFDWIGYDTVAAIVNDLCAVGALPLMMSAYFATGSPDWYAAPGRFDALVSGWRRGCDDSGAVWGGGESPMLSGVVEPGEIDLAGCAVGIIPEGRPPLLGDLLQPGDEIVLVASTGLHTNGASLAREAARRAGGLEQKLPGGQTLGDALLAPSAIYVRLVEALYAAGTPLSYTTPITGHGLRKLMRADRQLSYRVTQLPAVPEVFAYITDVLALSTAEAYGTFNMGAGFALFCPRGEGERAVTVATEQGYKAYLSGQVQEGPRSVVLEPVGVVFEEGELRLR